MLLDAVEERELAPPDLVDALDGFLSDLANGLVTREEKTAARRVLWMAQKDIDAAWAELTAKGEAA